MIESLSVKPSANVEEAIGLIFEELQHAEKKHPTFPNDVIHMLGILIEEAGEAMKEAIDLTYATGDIGKLRKELAQTGAMVIRALINLPILAKEVTYCFNVIGWEHKIVDIREILYIDKTPMMIDGSLSGNLTNCVIGFKNGSIMTCDGNNFDVFSKALKIAGINVCSRD